MSDHPLIRKHLICPLCDLHKGQGLVVCWPCYRLWDMRNGDPAVEAELDLAERHLEARERNANVLAKAIATLDRSGLKYNPACIKTWA